MTAQSQSNDKQIIICDTNIVLLMMLFKPSVMFTANYSYGKIKVHQCVVDQLQSWINKKDSKKVARFTKEIIQDTINACEKLSKGIKEPTRPQFDRSIAYISKVEGELDSSQKGSATDRVDKLLLILAYANKAYLATQENTMTNIAKITLRPERVLRFEDLVLDLINLKLLSKVDIETGLHCLDSFEEILNSKKRSLILEKSEEL